MKANNNDHNQIMALDIGSSKVSCVIARSQIDKKIFIEGISSISYRPSNENKSSDNQEMIEAINDPDSNWANNHDHAVHGMAALFEWLMVFIAHMGYFYTFNHDLKGETVQ